MGRRPRPEDAFVDHLELIVGVDLFTANHRISRVGVRKLEAWAWSCGELPKDLRDDEQVALDSTQRGLQRIPVQACGGLICTWVLATTPGTKKAWRGIAELCAAFSRKGGAGLNGTGTCAEVAPSASSITHARVEPAVTGGEEAPAWRTRVLCSWSTDGAESRRT